ncbi:MAG: hypothetical protein ACXWWC_14705 [Chitinophagaceae bacterium]
MDNSKKNDDLERQINELYNNLSKNISKKVRGLSEEDRLKFLRQSDPTNPSLINLYERAKENEDYETCAAAKALLLERGIQISN